MKCMVCEVPFCQEDAEMIQRDNDIAICDDCAYEQTGFAVDYDGSTDLLDHLKEYVRTSTLIICVSCNSKIVELTKIKFGTPVDAYIRCEVCTEEDKIDIYLKMV